MSEDQEIREYEPNFAQAIIGNTYGRFDFGVNEDYVAEKLYELSGMLGKKIISAQTGEFNRGYGHDFENEVFEMHPYFWCDCTCGFDEKDAVFSDEHPHAEACFHDRYRTKEECLEIDGMSSSKRFDLMTKWAKKNGCANAPNGMAIYCNCGADEAYTAWRNDNDHAPNCRIVVPNFKCGDLEIRWYKYIGRGMSVNRKVSREELRQVFNECRQSLK